MKLTDALAPGRRVFVSTLTTESAQLMTELNADPDRARGVTFSGVQFPGIDRADYLAVHPQARQSAYFMTPSVRTGLAEGRARLYSLDYQGVMRQLAEAPPFDVAIAQLSLPDADGWCTPGLCSDFMPLVWPRALRKIAHLNPRLPRIPGDFRVHVSALDGVVEAETPLLEWSEPRAGQIEKGIGAHVAALVEDGDTLQFGIGAVPVALAEALANHRRLRIYGGMIVPALGKLWQAGAIDRDARITTGVVLGDAPFFDFAARLESLWLTDISRTHDVTALASIRRFVAINTAVEVDLFGQINGERADGTIMAGAGGLPSYAAGALASPGGRLLICLPSTAKRGTTSRIVPALDANALCTLPRYMADAVITEHGIAELRNKSLDERAEALMGIAAPERRAELADAWRKIRQTS